jgi:hypothetical protein
MELFVVVMLALVLTTATARYAVWFECDARHTTAIVAATAAIVVIAAAVGIGGAPPTVGLVLIIGVMAALVGHVSEYNGGLRDKAVVATIIALAHLPPNVTTNRVIFTVLGLGVFTLAVASWRGKPSHSSCG